MVHLVNLLYVFSFSLAVTALFDASFMYHRFRKEILISWIVFLISLTLFLISISLEHYIALFELPSQLNVLDELFERVALVGCTYSVPLFFHNLFGISLNRFQKIGIQLAIVAALVTGFFSLILSSEIFSNGTLVTLLFGTILYTTVVSFRNKNNIGNKLIRKSISRFLSITLCFVPLFFVDIWYDVSPYTLSLPLYFFIVNISCILFSYKYLNQPAFIDDTGLTSYFIQSYALTDRECDIITRILQSESNKEIAETLFISTKTVESHISNIYRKTNVSSRTRLVNLIRTNRQ